VTCIDVSTGASTTETEWIADEAAPPTATPAQAPVPAVDPYSVALQAENTIDLPRPTIHTDPAGSAVVNLATWLWIDRPEWHPYSVSATVGPVTATAVATPVRVTWSMGEGDIVTCTGPGTPFDLDRPASSQATDCSFTYRVASAGQTGQTGQTGPDGAAGGSFVVSAAIDWSVSWSAQGAAGGGTLPALVTTASSRLRVEQVESINSYQALAGTSPSEGVHLS
jgi:hypothetical protein